MKTAIINDHLALVELPIGNLTIDAPIITQAKNNIWIIDRSGSMWYELKNVIEDACEQVKNLPLGDTLTVAWFSGTGDWGYIVKGFQIATLAARESAITMLRRNATTRNTTCFSEVLWDMQNVVHDLSAVTPNFHLMFFTDGYPVVNDYAAEIDSINRAVDAVAGKLNSVLLVGYGDFYNRELMSQMAERLGGALVHSSNIRVYQEAFGRWLGETKHVLPRQEVTIPLNILDGVLAVFTVQGSQIAVYPTDQETVMVAPGGGEDRLYVLAECADAPDSNVPLSEMEQGAFAAAYVLSQRVKTDLALEVLGALGDVDLIDTLNNAYTNEEAGKAEQLIQAATLSKPARYLRGKNTKYLPDPNAFCVLDALDLLAEDPDAKFYPDHPSFQYKRIGRPVKTKDGYPKFEAEWMASSPCSTLTYHDEKLNVSLTATIGGKVALQGDYLAHGFGSDCPCVKIRSYAVIADGVLNAQVLPLSMGPDSFFRLKQAGAIDDGFEYAPDHVYEVKLSRLPIINRGMAEGRTSAYKLCTDILTELSLEGKLKALKFLRDELDPEKALLRKTTLTPEQETFLAENGVNAQGIYSPPTEQGEATDFYMAKHFRVKAKGYSSLPSIKEVRQRVKDDKKITPAGLLVQEGLAMFAQLAPKGSVREQLAWLDSTIEDLKLALRKVRREVQRTKFAVLLSRKWFDEFTSRDDNKLMVDDVEFTIEVVEKKVEF